MLVFFWHVFCRAFLHSRPCTGSPLVSSCSPNPLMGVIQFAPAFGRVCRRLSWPQTSLWFHSFWLLCNVLTGCSTTVFESAVREDRVFHCSFSPHLAMLTLSLASLSTLGGWQMSRPSPRASSSGHYQGREHTACLWAWDRRQVFKVYFLNISTFFFSSKSQRENVQGSWIKDICCSKLLNMRTNICHVTLVRSVLFQTI